MKVLVALFLTLSVLLSTSNRSFVPGVFDNVPESQQVVRLQPELSVVPDHNLELPILSLVILPGLMSE